MRTRGWRFGSRITAGSRSTPRRRRLRRAGAKSRLLGRGRSNSSGNLLHQTRHVDTPRRCHEKRHGRPSRGGSFSTPLLVTLGRDPGIARLRGSAPGAGWRPSGEEGMLAELERALARSGRPLSDGVTLSSRRATVPHVARRRGVRPPAPARAVRRRDRGADASPAARPTRTAARRARTRRGPARPVGASAVRNANEGIPPAARRTKGPRLSKSRDPTSAGRQARPDAVGTRQFRSRGS